MNIIESTKEEVEKIEDDDLYKVAIRIYMFKMNPYPLRPLSRIGSDNPMYKSTLHFYLKVKEQLGKKKSFNTAYKVILLLWYHISLKDILSDKIPLNSILLLKDSFNISVRKLNKLKRKNPKIISFSILIKLISNIIYNNITHITIQRKFIKSTQFYHKIFLSLLKQNKYDKANSYR